MSRTHPCSSTGQPGLKACYAIRSITDSYQGPHKLCNDAVLHGSREDPVRRPSEARILICKKWDLLVMSPALTRTLLGKTKALTFRILGHALLISFPAKQGKWQNISRKQFKGLLQPLGTLCKRNTPTGEIIHYESSLIHFSPYLGQGEARVLDLTHISLNRILITVRHEEGHYKHAQQSGSKGFLQSLRCSLMFPSF